MNPKRRILSALLAYAVALCAFTGFSELTVYGIGMSGDQDSAPGEQITQSSDLPEDKSAGTSGENTPDEQEPISLGKSETVGRVKQTKQGALSVWLEDLRLEEVLEASGIDLSEVRTLVIEDGLLLAEDFSYLRETMGNTLEEFDCQSAEIEDDRLCGQAFARMEELHTVLLPESLEEIGSYAFFGCINLTSVNLPSVKTVRTGAFALCRSLQEIEMPLAETLQKSAFLFCKKLANVELPSLVSLGDFAFGWCTSIRELVFPCLTSVGKGTFTGCSRLSRITLSGVAMAGETVDVETLEDNEIMMATALGDFAFGRHSAPSSDPEDVEEEQGEEDTNDEENQDGEDPIGEDLNEEDTSEENQTNEDSSEGNIGPQNSGEEAQGEEKPSEGTPDNSAPNKEPDNVTDNEPDKEKPNDETGSVPAEESEKEEQEELSDNSNNENEPAEIPDDK